MCFLNKFVLVMSRIILVSLSVFIICTNAKKEKSDKEKCKICGYKGVEEEDITFRIVNGDVFKHEKYPWLVSIAEGDHKIFCTGALISSKFIMTAAHCMEDEKCERDLCFRSARKLRVAVRDETDVERSLEVAEVIPHPDYDGKPKQWVLHHDIALLKLKDEVSKCSSQFGPICLMNKNYSGVEKGQELKVAGWGFSTTSGDSKPNEKRKPREGTIQTLSSEKCTKTKKKTKYSDTIICGVSSSKSKEEQIPCQGDSGSSVFKKVDGVYYSLGVGSTIRRDKDSKKCPLDGKVKYTKVAHHLAWIEEKVKDLPKPARRE